MIAAISVPWLVDRGRVNWPRVLLLALVGGVLVGVVFFSATSTAAFGPFNPNWDGTAQFRGQISDEPGVKLTTATDTTVYERGEPNDTTVFVVAPDEEYGQRDIARVRSFVEQGGTLVVLEDFAPTGNSLLTGVGANARIDGRLIRDEQHHDRAPTMPVATGVGNHSLTTDVEQLTLNYASVVEPNNATVLIRTSEFAYFTESADEGLDDNTTLQAMPVATLERVGEGRVVVVSDPSITTNVMLDRPDNAAFLKGLYADADRVVIDRSHAGGIPPLRRALLAIRGSTPLQLLVGGLAVVAVAVFAHRRPFSSVRQTITEVANRFGFADSPTEVPLSAMSDDQRKVYLRQQHPEWDEQRIERVITAFNQTDGEGWDDD